MLLFLYFCNAKKEKTIMIRAVTLQDTSAITAIYNEYIAHSTSTFDIEPVSKEEM